MLSKPAQTTLAGVYLEAAASVHYGHQTYSCLAVVRCSNSNAVARFERLFAHRDYWKTFDTFWLEGRLGSAKARKEWRVTALCLMAAIAADEEGTI